MSYLRGVETNVEGHDSGKLSYFEALNLVKYWIYDNCEFRVWREIERIDECFFHMNDGANVEEITNICIVNKVDGKFELSIILKII